MLCRYRVQCDDMIIWIVLICDPFPFSLFPSVYLPIPLSPSRYLPLSLSLLSLPLALSFSLSAHTHTHTCASHTPSRVLQVYNAVTVSSTESLFLLTLNCLGLLLIISLLILGKITGKNKWPTHNTLNRIYSSPSLLPPLLHWIECIREATCVNADCQFYRNNVTPETVDIKALEDSLRRLRQCWIQASTVGSLFTIILTDTLDTLMRTHGKIHRTALRKVDHWDDAFVSKRKMFAQSDKFLKLTPALKRRLLVKLLAVRAFIGHRVLTGGTSKTNRYINPNNTPNIEVIQQLQLQTEAYIRDMKTNAELSVDTDLGHKLFDQWDSIINHFDVTTSGGENGAEQDIENWYTYRHLLEQALDGSVESPRINSRVSPRNNE